ncbi:MAG TPA: polyprenyl synthetase family protein [Longimicrobiales bacterium]|nr:polyprenyl synthetase family protein [Longimicrobiales bacterium]
MSAPGEAIARRENATDGSGAGTPAPTVGRVEAGLAGALAGLGDAPLACWSGSLSRPSLALGVARKLRGEAGLPAGFWQAALAIQLAHEASLVHDDIVDSATVRRGRPSYVALHGVASAVLHGDRLLTTAYRAAAATTHAGFVTAFADALARMVAGEASHRRSGARALTDAEYVAMVSAKTGELLGLALSAAAVLAGDGRAPELASLGRRTGVVYQRVDDLLDYCPSAPGGKPRLLDHDNGRWTWVLGSPSVPLDAGSAEVRRFLFAPGPNGSPMRRALARVREEADAVRSDLRRLLGHLPPLESMLDGWVEAARDAIASEESAMARDGAGHASVGISSPVPPGQRRLAAGMG